MFLMMMMMVEWLFDGEWLVVVADSKWQYLIVDLGNCDGSIVFYTVVILTENRIFNEMLTKNIGSFVKQAMKGETYEDSMSGQIGINYTYSKLANLYGKFGVS